MSCHPSGNRSRFQKSRISGWQYAESDDHSYVPAPLNIQKANLTATPVMQRLDPASIGLAMGSPSDSPLPPIPNQSPIDTNAFEFRIPSPTRRCANTDSSGKKRKAKGVKWITLGGLLSKRHARDMANCVEESPLYPTDLTIQREWQYASSKPKAVSRKRVGLEKENAMESPNALVSKEIARKLSLLKRVSSKRKGGRRKPAADGERDTPQERRNPYRMKPAERLSGIRTQSGESPLLRVEIPDVQLERYSVMFGNVLQPDSGEIGASTSLTKSRQVNGGDDKTVIIAPEPPPTINDSLGSHRRDSSGSSATSRARSFSLFPPLQSSPAKNITNKPLPKLSPLGRSGTAPNAASKMALPPRPPLKASNSQDQSQIFSVAPRKENLPVSKSNISHSRLGSQAASAQNHSLDHSINSGKSHGTVPKLSFDNSVHSAHSHSQKPSFDPSVRSLSDSQGSVFDLSDSSSNKQQVSRPTTASTSDPPTTSSVRQESLNRVFPIRQSSLKRSKAADKPTQVEPELPEPPKQPFANNDTSQAGNGSLNGAAEVSIARQISISRRQRQLLIPVVAKQAKQPTQP